MRPAAALAGLALGVAGCTLSPAERIGRVEPGMSPRQVESYLGPATSVLFRFQCRGRDCDGSASWFFTNNGEPAPPIAVAIGPPSSAWSAAYRQYRAKIEAEFGRPDMACTQHAIDYGQRYYCFADDRLLFAYDQPTVFVPAPAVR